MEQPTVTELFTCVYVLVDDYLKASEQQGRFVLPHSPHRKGSYGELMTTALVGDLLNQTDTGWWFNLVKHEYKALFPALPDDTHYYRVLNKLERIWADFALSLTAQHEVLAYSIDSKPLPVQTSQAASGDDRSHGRFSKGAVYGFKLHALITPRGLIVKFAVAPAHEADVTVARALLDEPEP